jgi:FRG domain protein
MCHDIEPNSTDIDTILLTLEKEIQIDSVSEFIKKIGLFNKVEVRENTETFYYRGHADRKWGLLPSIFRTSNGVEKEHLLFRDMVAHIPQSFSECRSALDYLVQMQHYELPTRLLDVTTNPLVALYFACESADDVIARIEAGHMKGGEVFYSFRSQERVNFTRLDSHDQDALQTIANMLGALAGASDASPTYVEELAPVLVSDIFSQNPEARDLAYSLAKSVTMAASEAGATARNKDGIIYLFSVPNDRVKHYDSDTISVLANLAKCDYREMDIKKYGRRRKVLEKFNKQDGIRILLRQIKEEKPYFEPLIRPEDLSSIFLVKPKYGNPRIINQAGAFFIFGLGPGCGGHLTKKVDAGIPSDWIRHKFIVPKDKKKKILEELANLGMTESYIYPEMDKYAKELKKRYKL